MFQLDQTSLEAQLRELVLADQIHARIDSRNGSLVASSEPIRTNAFDESLKSSDVVEDTLVRMLLTKSILKDNLTVEDPRKREMMHHTGGMQGLGGMMSGMMGM